MGVALSSNGESALVLDSLNYVIRRVSLSSPYETTTFLGAQGASGDVDGNIETARFTNLAGHITVDPSNGNVAYLMDQTSSPGGKLKKLDLRQKDSCW